jgi:tetratricopeptide (TPR) repeat protein
MRQNIMIGLALCLPATVVCAQVTEAELRDLTNQVPNNRVVLGGGNDLLSAGAQAMMIGHYEDGIMLTEMGLARPGLSDAIRSAGLSNLCAAYAGNKDPERAIESCTQSLEINDRNWRAWSNRSYAYWLKGMYEEAKEDLEAATAINPDARQIFEIRGMLNEAGLRPRVITEDHQ